MTRAPLPGAPGVTTEEGLVADDPADTGALLVRLDGIDVRESSWAGAYYCAHVLWLASQWAAEERSTIARDRHGDPLVGFLHIPADPETNGGGNRSSRERHAVTARVLACALRGVLDELERAPGTNAHERERRVLVTGFGPFAAIVSNPTGDLVADDGVMAEALALAAGTAAASIDLLEAIDAGARRLHVHAAGATRLGRLLLDVDDHALDHGRAGSLPWALQRFSPHAVISLGVHRASAMYRVELEPTTAGLRLDGGAPRHERGRPLDARAPVNRALARAIERGAKKLGL
jgi:hypothetical protein